MVGRRVAAPAPHAPTGVAQFLQFMSEASALRPGSPYILCDVNLLQFMVSSAGVCCIAGPSAYAADCPTPGPEGGGDIGCVRGEECQPNSPKSPKPGGRPVKWQSQARIIVESFGNLSFEGLPPSPYKFLCGISATSRSN